MLLLWCFLRATEGYHNIKNKNHAKHPLQTNKKGVKCCCYLPLPAADAPSQEGINGFLSFTILCLSPMQARKRKREAWRGRKHSSRAVCSVRLPARLPNNPSPIVCMATSSVLERSGSSRLYAEAKRMYTR